MPKLPPPPRRPQSRSAFSLSLACTRQPSAVTTSAPTRLSQARPCLRISQPIPPPSVKPATPAVERAVPDPTGLRIPVVVGTHDAAADCLPQLLDCCLPENRGDGGTHDCLRLVVAVPPVLLAATLRGLCRFLARLCRRASVAATPASEPPAR